MGDRWVGRLQRWGAVFAGAFAVRIAYWLLITPHYVPVADGDQYRRLGQALADGDGFSLVYPQTAMHPTAFRPPLYPALLAPGNLLFGHALWPARLLSVFLGSLVVVLVGALAARIGGRRAGLAAAAFVALYPPLLANDTIVMTEALALALLVTAILLVDERRWVWGGVVVGLLALTRPNVYLVALVLGFWAWRRIGLRAGLGLLGCVLAVLAPWMIRNQIQVGTPRPTTSDGLTLVAIYGPISQRAGTFVDPVFSPAYGDLDHRLAQFDETDWNGKLTREAVRGVREHPSYVWYMVRRNFRGYFELSPDLNRFPEVSDGRNWSFTQGTRWLFFVVTALGLVGLARRWRDDRVLVVLVVVAQFVALSLLLVAPPRLRAPFDLAMCLGAGLLVADLLERRRDPAEPGDALEAGSPPATDAANAPASA